jgi:hypothetical protein
VEQRSWWRDGRTRTRVAVGAFLGLATLGILFAGFVRFTEGDRRVLVVTMEQDAGQALRDGLKAACGSLPGVSVVADRGNPDPRIQGRFPVRFAIGGITDSQLSALAACVNDQPGVRGFLTEGDAA